MLATKLRASVRTFVAERTTEREALVAKLETEKRFSVNASTTSPPPPLAGKPPLPPPPRRSSTSIESTLSSLSLKDSPRGYDGSPYNSTLKNPGSIPPPPTRQQSHYTSFKPYETTPYPSPPPPQQQQNRASFLPPPPPPPHLPTQSLHPSFSAPPIDPYANLSLFNPTTISPPPPPSQPSSSMYQSQYNASHGQPSQSQPLGAFGGLAPPQTYYSYKSQPHHSVSPPPPPGSMYGYPG